MLSKTYTVLLLTHRAEHKLGEKNQVDSGKNKNLGTQRHILETKGFELTLVKVALREPCYHSTYGV